MMIFQSARIKLTIWYVIITMLVSLFFSFLLYRGIMSEIKEGLSRAEQRFIILRNGSLTVAPEIHQQFVNDYQLSQKRVVFALVSTNGLILVLASAAGYFLAGKTLRPIEEAMEEQKRFVADASHELKTPLTSLRTEIEVTLRDKNLTKKDAVETLKSNLEEIVSIQSLANYLLTLSRLEPGDMTEKTKTNLEDCIHEAIRRVEKNAKKKSIAVHKESEKVIGLVNKQSISELITILLDNAVKYSDEDKKISIKLNKRKNQAQISIKDQGFGIKEAEIPYIFNRFYRADSSRSKQNIEGFGLGLSIARSIVVAHNGSIEVESTPKNGSTFIVKLPLNSQ